ncbi:unnamed protein product, partial [Rotaria sp. Silwood2]
PSPLPTSSSSLPTQSSGTNKKISDEEISFMQSYRAKMTKIVEQCKVDRACWSVSAQCIHAEPIPIGIVQWMILNIIYTKYIIQAEQQQDTSS